MKIWTNRFNNSDSYILPFGHLASAGHDDDLELKIIKIKARWKMDLGVVSNTLGLGFKILPGGLYSTVDWDVEGWVDGVVYTKRINGFTCCDSVD